MECSSAPNKAGVFSAGLQERRETVRGVYSVIDQLSRTHLSTLERLIFHLVRYTGQAGQLWVIVGSGRGEGAAFTPGFCSNLFFPSGLLSKKRPTECQLTPWPSSLLPVSSAAPTRRTPCKAFRTSVKQPRKKSFSMEMIKPLQLCLLTAS